MSRRTGFTGSALVDLLTRFTGADVRPSRQSFADQLSQWLGWTDAIALSGALNGGGSGPAPAGMAPAAVSSGHEDGQCAQVRSAVAAAIAEDLRAALRDPTPADFAPYRRRYLGRQQAMASSIEALRDRLRETLAARSPAMARLAEVDVVMTHVLEPQEQRLFASVPKLLEKHFKRLRTADQATQDATDPAETPPTAAWLDVFCKDMQSVLLAELDLRLQPVEGLLEALRAR